MSQQTYIHTHTHTHTHTHRGFLGCLEILSDLIICQDAISCAPRPRYLGCFLDASWTGNSPVFPACKCTVTTGSDHPATRSSSSRRRYRIRKLDRPAPWVADSKTRPNQPISDSTFYFLVTFEIRHGSRRNPSPVETGFCFYWWS